MPFKMSWEQPHAQLTLPEAIIKQMICGYSSKANTDSIKPLPGGCSNLNLAFDDGNTKKILRIFMQDAFACGREQALSALLCDTLPVARFYHTGIVDQYHYAIIEYKSGEPLRDVLLREPESVTAPLLYTVGAMLAKLSAYQFDYAGFFDEFLQVKQPFSTNGYAEYLTRTLHDQSIREHLGTKLIESLTASCQRSSVLLPDASSRQLVHGDFNPSNILVKKTANGYEVSALLDFEFAFSGSNLCDVASMLRYAHTFDWSLQQHFISGIENHSEFLPENWRASIKLLNCLSLLDCLKRTDAETEPCRLDSIKQSLHRLAQQLKALEPMPGKQTLDRARELFEITDLKFVRKMENFVYSCQYQDQPAFLRLTPKTRRSYDAIHDESSFLSRLKECHIPSVQLLKRNIPAKTGASDIFKIEDHFPSSVAEIDDKQYTACLFEKVKGEHPSPKRMLDSDFITQLGELIASMHNMSGMPSLDDNREFFQEERGMRYALKAAKHTKHKAFKKHFEEIIEWAESQGQNSTVFGLIHADLGASNLFLHDGKIIPIDFDDCFYFLHAFDFAIPMCSAMIENHRVFSIDEEKAYIDALQKGYCKKRAFSQKQRESVPKLIELACLRLFFWIEQHTYLDTFDPKSWSHVAKVQFLAKNYLTHRLGTNAEQITL